MVAEKRNDLQLQLCAAPVTSLCIVSEIVWKTSGLICGVEVMCAIDIDWGDSNILTTICNIKFSRHNAWFDRKIIHCKSTAFQLKWNLGYCGTEWNEKKYLILLSVRIRIHCGMEQFCLSFLPNLRLILNVLWAAYGKNRMFSNQLNVNIALASQINCKSYFLFRKKIRGAHTMSSEYPRVKKLTETFWQCVRVHIESD